IAGWHDTSGREPPDRLRDAADVVRDGGHARAEGLEERAALIELRAVREQCDRGVAKCALDLVGRQVPEAPLGSRAGGLAPPVQRLKRVAGDQQPRALDAIES